MSRQNPRVSGFIRKNKRWSAELERLRSIVLESELIEEVKWRVPVYTLQGKNVVFLGAFKDNCTISFVKGALLKDPKRILEKPGENTQSAKVARFRGVDEIDAAAETLTNYIAEAIDVEKAGTKVPFKTTAQFEMPAELTAKFKTDSALKNGFAKLTPGRQRGYLLHFSSAKQSKTRDARIERNRERILAGKGLEDD